MNRNEEQWLQELRDLCVGEHGLEPEDWDDFMEEWGSIVPPPRQAEPMGGHLAKTLFVEGKSPSEVATVLANEEYWPQPPPKINDGPPYDAATRTGMYDHD